MIERIKKWLKPKPLPCEQHDYRLMTVPTYTGALLTWEWCRKCGAPLPRKEWNPK